MRPTLHAGGQYKLKRHTGVIKISPGAVFLCLGCRDPVVDLPFKVGLSTVAYTLLSDQL